MSDGSVLKLEVSEADEQGDVVGNLQASTHEEGVPEQTLWDTGQGSFRQP